MKKKPMTAAEMARRAHEAQKEKLGGDAAFRDDMARRAKLPRGKRERGQGIGAKRDEPNPGSEAAVRNGCTCPVMDNHFGKGVPSSDGVQFWHTEGCPLHDKR